MTFLALDLGALCGYAIYKDDKVISGTKKLRVDKRASGSRFLDFRNWLIQVIKKYSINKVFFERVYGHTGTEAAHIFGGYMYTLATVCLELNIECVGLAVKSIKKFMTGMGNATKNQMIAAARSLGFDPKTDDEADAIAILLLGVESTSDFQSCHIKSPQKQLPKSACGSFQALIMSGRQPPAISLATEVFQRLTE